jgi:hypothetical protein
LGSEENVIQARIEAAVGNKLLPIVQSGLAFLEPDRTANLPLFTYEGHEHNHTDLVQPIASKREKEPYQNTSSREPFTSSTNHIISCNSLVGVYYQRRSHSMRTSLDHKESLPHSKQGVRIEESISLGAKASKN